MSVLYVFVQYTYGKDRRSHPFYNIGLQIPRTQTVRFCFKVPSEIRNQQLFQVRPQETQYLANKEMGILPNTTAEEHGTGTFRAERFTR